MSGPGAQPGVHAVGLHHTVPDERFSHCAFTGKVLRFPRVSPYPVIEYSNGLSASGAAKHVRIRNEKQLRAHFGDTGLFENCTTTNNLDTQWQQAWLSDVRQKLARNVKRGDFIAHVYEPMPQLVSAFPDAIHVETGIGYANAPSGCYRIFESESWRAWHAGRHCAPDGSAGTWPNYPELQCTAVVPNYYDPSQWALGEGPAGASDYALFVGRMTSAKGIEIVNWLAEQFPNLTIKVVSGEPRSDRLTAPNIEWLGRVDARSELGALYGGALCTIAPSMFWEPFGGVAVESLLCGTPVICPDYAAFVETVAHPDDGLRCAGREEYAHALALVLDPNEGWASIAGRNTRRARAQERFGIEPVRIMYAAAFDRFRRLYAAGVRP